MDVAVQIGDDVPTLAVKAVGDGAGAVAFQEPLPFAKDGQQEFGEGLERDGGSERHVQGTLR
ncbi:hypothetical protein GCM10010309_45130 [Streptomyces violaceochromogenes]|nr:hypothetical protein GCM10010309_45130 [Streptomyces violaceochromogenes]